MNLSASEPSVLWSRSYLLVTATNFCMITAVSMLMSTLPLYVREIGGSAVMSGLVVGVYAFAALLCRPFIGRRMDIQGRRPAMIAGILLLLAAFLSLHAAASVALLLAIRVLQGIGFSAHSTAVATMIADVVPASRLTEGIGYYGISNTLPTAFGPPLGLFIIAQYGYHALFGVAAACAVIGLLLALPIRYESQVKPIREGKPVSPQAGWFEAQAAAPGLVMFLVTLGLGGIMTFVPQFAQERSIEGIGYYFTVYAFALLAIRLFSGKWADRFGSGSVLYPGLALITASFVILACSTSLPPVLLSALLFGLGFGSVQPVMNAAAVRRSPPERKGAASALFSASMDLGMGAGSILWGAMSVSWGFASVYLVCALCALLSAGMYMHLIGRKRNTAATYKMSQ
jgi:MFS family permease